MSFKRSKIYLSVIRVVVVGLISAYRRGDGHWRRLHLIPIMMYLCCRCRTYRIRTSWCDAVTMVSPTMLHAESNHLVRCGAGVDLMVGGSRDLAAQFGATRLDRRFAGEPSAAALGLRSDFAVGVRFAIELVIPSDDLFTIGKPEAPE